MRSNPAKYTTNCNKESLAARPRNERFSMVVVGGGGVAVVVYMLFVICTFQLNSQEMLHLKKIVSKLWSQVTALLLPRSSTFLCPYRAMGLSIPNASSPFFIVYFGQLHANKNLHLRIYDGTTATAVNMSNTRYLYWVLSAVLSCKTQQPGPVSQR